MMDFFEAYEKFNIDPVPTTDESGEVDEKLFKTEPDEVSKAQNLNGEELGKYTKEIDTLKEQNDELKKELEDLKKLMEDKKDDSETIKTNP